MVQRWFRRSLLDIVPRDQRDTPAGLRRRQIVTVTVIGLGAVLLGISLRIEPGSPWFYPATLALGALWFGGAFASGRLHLGRIAAWRDDDRLIRPVVAPILLGVGLSAVFVAGGLVVREIDWLDRQVRSVMDFAEAGSLPLLLLVTVVNGIAEETFFRGAVYAAIPRRPVLWSTIAYVVATLATGNVMLAFAAILLGTVVGLQRRASGGILAPILTHCIWSTAMLFALPALFG